MVVLVAMVVMVVIPSGIVERLCNSMTRLNVIALFYHCQSLRSSLLLLGFSRRFEVVV